MTIVTRSQENKPPPGKIHFVDWPWRILPDTNRPPKERKHHETETANRA